MSWLVGASLSTNAFFNYLHKTSLQVLSCLSSRSLTTTPFYGQFHQNFSTLWKAEARLKKSDLSDMLSPSSPACPEDYLVLWTCNNNIPKNIITINRLKTWKVISDHKTIQVWTSYIFFFFILVLSDSFNKICCIRTDIFLVCFFGLVCVFWPFIDQVHFTWFCKDPPFSSNFSFSFERRFFN